jgi:hypothetical protein
MTQVQPPVLLHDGLGEPAILFHDPGVVLPGDEQDIQYFVLHQIVKNLETRVIIVQTDAACHRRSPPFIIGCMLRFGIPIIDRNPAMVKKIAKWTLL